MLFSPTRKVIGRMSIGPVLSGRLEARGLAVKIIRAPDAWWALAEQ